MGQMKNFEGREEMYEYLMEFIESDEFTQESYLEAINLAEECVKTGRKFEINDKQFRKPIKWSKKEIREECKYVLDVSNNNLSGLYLNYGLIEKTLDYLLRSEIDTDNPVSFISFSTIGGLYDKLGNVNEARKYYLKSQKILEVKHADDKKRGVIGIIAVVTVLTRTGIVNWDHVVII